ncbi:MAG: hypothetical protein AAGE52_08590 [Myxococcota bacterium]
MDRAELRAWLRAPSRTWRWNRGTVERYDGVEFRAGRLRWFRWSHEADEGSCDEAVQTVEEFVREGAPPAMKAPPSVVAELRAWIDRHA